MRAELFLGLRYLKPERNAVGVITVISITGVTLGVAVLIIVLSVMTGFTELMKEKLLDTQSHIQIQSTYSNEIFSPKEIVDEIEAVGGQGVPVVFEPALVQVRQSLEPSMMVMGVHSEDLAKQLDFDAVLKYGSFDLKKSDIVVSERFARNYGLSLGDKVLLHSPKKLTDMVKIDEYGEVKLNDENAIYLPSEFKVAGIFSFNKYDFDSSVVFIDLNDATELFDYRLGSSSMVYGYFDDPYNMDKEYQILKEELSQRGFRVRSWQERNQHLLGVLAVEKRMMFFLLIFIVLVAAFSITNTLITSVYRKTKEIGILKALGATSGACMRIFVYQGMFVGVMGSIVGTFLGLIVIHFRNDILRITSKITGQELFPPEFYHFNELPAKIVVSDVVLIVIVSIILCTIGGIIPSIRAAKLDPAKALRYE